MFVGSWLFNELNVIKYVRDATPIVPPEPIAEIQGISNDVLRQLLNRLRLMISLASLIAWIKRLGLRVFIHGSALYDPVNDFIKAALAGGVDGLIPGDFVRVSDETINIISTSPGDSPLNYVFIDSMSTITSISRSYGAILMNAPLDRNWLLRARDKLKLTLGVKEIFVAMDASLVNTEIIKDVTDVIDGFVVMEIPNMVSLGFDDNAALNVFRCTNCYIDFETSGEIRKCPRCGGRVRPVIKSWGKVVSFEDKVLRLKGLEELRLMKMEAPKIINLP